jgi:hypothetical protein
MEILKLVGYTLFIVASITFCIGFVIHIAKSVLK